MLELVGLFATVIGAIFSVLAYLGGKQKKNLKLNIELDEDILKEKILELLKSNPNYHIETNDAAKNEINNVFSSIKTYDLLISNLYDLATIIALFVSIAVCFAFKDFSLIFVFICFAIAYAIISPIKYFWKINLKNKIHEFNLRKEDIHNLIDLINNHKWEDSDTSKEVREILLTQ